MGCWASTRQDSVDEVGGLNRRLVVMAFAIFMFGLAMVLFGTAWGLVFSGAATPLVMTVCLLIAGIAIWRVARFGSRNDWNSGQARRAHVRRLYGRRRSHHAQAADSH